MERKPEPDTVPTVVVVDDDPGMRHALSILLGAHGYHVLECGSAEEVLERGLLDLDTTCCFLLDVTMGEISGLDLFYMMRERGCSHKVVFLSGACDTQSAVDAYRDGAIDFVVKSDAHDRVVDAVRAAFHAHRREMEAARQARETRALLSTLTTREQQVAELIAMGYTNAQIAWELSIATNTVKVHRANVKRKLGVQTATELIRLFPDLEV